MYGKIKILNIDPWIPCHYYFDDKYCNNEVNLKRTLESNSTETAKRPRLDFEVEKTDFAAFKKMIKNLSKKN